MALFNSDDNQSLNQGESPIWTRWSWLLKDLVLLSCIGLAIFLFVVLFSFDPNDPGFQKVGHADYYYNYGGATGAWLSSFLLYLFGVFGFAWPFGILMAGWVTLKVRSNQDFDWGRFLLSLTGLMLIILSGSGMASLFLHPDNWLVELPYFSGGVLGYELSVWLVGGFDLLATTLILLILFAVGMSMLIGQSWLTICEVTGRAGWWLIYAVLEKLPTERWRGLSVKQIWINLNLVEKIQGWLKNKKAERARIKEHKVKRTQAVETQRSRLVDEPNLTIPPISPKAVDLNLAGISRKVKPVKVDSPVLSEEPVLAQVDAPFDRLQEETSQPTLAQQGAVAIEPKYRADSASYHVKEPELPCLSLLDPAPVYDDAYSEEELQAMSLLLETRLQEFGVTVTVEAVLPGPVVTSFELMPAAGVKVSQISNLSKDLARALAVQAVRVVDVIPGKSCVGIEIPNAQREIVGFSDILSSEAFQNSSAPLTLGLGKDISGKPVVANLAKMPHVLVAGTTGSGKSVGVNSMILSMLYKSTAKDVRLIMVDPKMLELSIYEDIPHLLTPVVTDMSDAANALRWCVFEMDRRYMLMAKMGVRNIGGFNEKVQAAIDKGEPIPDPLYEQAKTMSFEMSDAPPTLEPLPYIVVVIDEFADMIMVVGKKVEELIARLAQKARASGIHLILATQRPSVNVITGLIKANIPTRISFQVSSKIDSRTVLDQMGAEQLLGMGDMLYLPPGSGSPIRVHGAFVSDDEVHRVVDFIKQQGAPQYLEAITRDPDSMMSSGGAAGDPSDAEQDVIYDEAVEFVVQSGRVSISSVQRRFKIGYNRAARIVEAMEAAGVVSTMQANGNREVLVPKSD
ncbi:DNA translocase FtsK 4TM domain-containing protein [Thiomicrospira sp. R3]|uniref:DNA translocase FtsK n=1 Tax=Thiomicrospira sp. R3 TaxID=3035472 RepID=UPI00259B0477|nr:DNA translocase FtsK [Thiomicrospira sp. R3]WFE68619.1 DNA translocase FtsK 4TM domain-containing protein [Thiomicrospira sp. R3]